MTGLDAGNCIVDTQLGVSYAKDKAVKQNHKHMSLNNLMFTQFVSGTYMTPETTLTYSYTC